MELYRLLGIRRGITAVIGGGGKTTLVKVLAEELTAAGRRVICTTSTHIFPFAGMPLAADLRSAAERLASCPAVCVGLPGPEGKLTAPACSMEELAAVCDMVLVEADGSKRLPLKAHAPHEPVIPPGTGRTVLVAGASGIGRPVRAAVHRWERFCALTGLGPEDPVTEAALARLIRAEGLGDLMFLNQLDVGPGRPDLLAKELEVPALGGALQKGAWRLY